MCMTLEWAWGLHSWVVASAIAGLLWHGCVGSEWCAIAGVVGVCSGLLPWGLLSVLALASLLSLG